MGAETGSVMNPPSPSTNPDVIERAMELWMIRRILPGDRDMLMLPATSSNVFVNLV
jgi:hypothetical protein